jgi:5'-nucleotidase
VTLREIANAGNLKFTDEIVAIRNESTKLRQMGVNIIVVLSHCGLDRDKIIAMECGDYVDVIVGGHSHSLLFTPAANAREVTAGSYPLVLTPKSGRERKVLIVHASAFTKYIGDLRVYFNAVGHVKYYDGNPIYLGSEIRKDLAVEEEIVVWRDEVLRVGNRIVGNTSVDLIHTQCRHGECRLGNFIVDAFVAGVANKGIKSVYSSFIQAAGLRSSFHSGSILYSDVIAALPFENTLEMLEVQGDNLYEVFEHSISRSYAENEFIGIHLLQVAGFRVTFNITNPVGKRVQSLKIRINSEDEEYESVQHNKFYSIVVPSFLANGGDGFTMLIKSKRKNHRIGLLLLDIEVIEAYIAQSSPITDDLLSSEQPRILILS